LAIESPRLNGPHCDEGPAANAAVSEAAASAATIPTRGYGQAIVAPAPPARANLDLCHERDQSPRSTELRQIIL